MPAAAVIPAPRAYMNVVAVKKPVVGFENFVCAEPKLGFGRAEGMHALQSSETCGNVHAGLPSSAIAESLHSQ